MKMLLSVLLASLGILDSCSEDFKPLEDEIRVTIVNDAPHLATLQSTYATVFTNAEENIVFPDNLYIRRDLARIKYGYSLTEAEIEIREIKGRKSLIVKLGSPKEIARDRRIIYVETTDKEYRPKRGNGEIIDVDKEIETELDGLVSIYEKKSLERAEESIKRYFSLLAKQYNLDLYLEFRAKGLLLGEGLVGKS